MKDLFAPNRVAVLTALVAAVAGALVTLLGAVDSVPKAIVVVAALVVVAVVIVVYLLGSQRDEARKFAALKPAEQNAIAIDEAPIAAWSASEEGKAAARERAPSTSIASLQIEIAQPDTEPPDVDLGDPADLADETDAGALPTPHEHAHLSDGDTPTEPIA